MLSEFMGPRSDDRKKRFDLSKFLTYGIKEVDLENTRPEYLNILINYLRGLGLDLHAYDENGKKID
jgi:hypothetical protein